MALGWNYMWGERAREWVQWGPGCMEFVKRLLSRACDKRLPFTYPQMIWLSSTPLPKTRRQKSGLIWLLSLPLSYFPLGLGQRVRNRVQPTPENLMTSCRLAAVSFPCRFSCRRNVSVTCRPSVKSTSPLLIIRRPKITT